MSDPILDKYLLLDGCLIMIHKNTESILLECRGPSRVVTPLMSVEVRLTLLLLNRSSQYLTGGGFAQMVAQNLLIIWAQLIFFIPEVGETQ